MTSLALEEAVSHEGLASLGADSRDIALVIWALEHGYLKRVARGKFIDPTVSIPVIMNVTEAADNFQQRWAQHKPVKQKQSVNIASIPPTLNQILNIRNPDPSLYPHLGLALMYAVQHGDARAQRDSSGNITFTVYRDFGDDHPLTPIEAYQIFKDWGTYVAAGGSGGSGGGPHGYS